MNKLKDKFKNDFISKNDNKNVLTDYFDKIKEEEEKKRKKTKTYLTKEFFETKNNKKLSNKILSKVKYDENDNIIITKKNKN
jgi:hypothetical protein